MKKAETKEYLERLRQAVNADLLKGIDPARGTLEAAMHYALSLPGKRLRPMLFLSLLDARRADSLRHVAVASALEMIHTYSLIHDDLPAMDNDGLRRGQPTVHIKFSESTALLAGDALLTYAFELLAEAPLPAATSVAIIGLISRAIGKQGMAGGQILDLEFSGEQENIAAIHRLKTAELIRASLLAAAQILNFSQAEQGILAAAGEELGLGFQLADDLLDINGNKQEVGKRLNKDRLQQRPNAAVYLGSEAVRARIAAYHERARSEISRLGIDFPPLLALMEMMLFRNR